jgi:uncharacterized coiled-coil protein SlyX
MNHNYLASDDQNPDFVGAHNPDNRLTVRFYKQAVQNNFRSEQEGRPIYDELDMVNIHVPGDQLTAVAAIVREDHKRRFPVQWAMYQNQNSGDQALAGKTPLEHWPRLNKAQVAELKHLKFLSVEDIAFASDTQLQAIGMSGGMSPFAFRDIAKRFLEMAAGEAAATKADARAADLERQLAEQREVMAQMQSQLAAMAAAQAAVAIPSFEALAAQNGASDAVDRDAPQRRTKAA